MQESFMNGESCPDRSGVTKEARTNSNAFAAHTLMNNSKPRRSWWKRILIGLVMLTIISALSRWIMYEIEKAQGEEELAAAIAETEALDPRWRWEQIEKDRETVPDNMNSVIVVKNFETVRGKWEPGSLKTKAGDELIPTDVDNFHLDEERLSILREELAKHRDAVAIAKKLVTFPRGRAGIEMKSYGFSTLLPHLQPSRTAANTLALESERILAEGESEGCFACVMGILNAGSGFRDEAFLISQLVRIAIHKIAVKCIERALALDNIDDLSLSNCNARLGEEEQQDLLVQALRGERTMLSNLFDNLRSDELPIADLDHENRKAGDWERDFGWFLYRSRLADDHGNALRQMNEIIRIAQLPTHEQSKAFELYRKRCAAAKDEALAKKKRIFSFLLLPAWNKVAEAALRDKALLRSTITALAAERYRLAEGKWPKQLDDLCPRYLPAVPTDPFDGEPLKLAVRDDGITIYSTGQDGVDNGGGNLTVTGREAGSDLGFRLWNVESRGLIRPRVVGEE